ncbi:MAG: hypothetical protein WBD99_09645 [Thermodesulfobacteriota bacterium]
MIENNGWQAKPKKKKDSYYKSMARVRKVRYRLSKSERMVFDVEIEPEYIDYSLEDKAKISGLSLKRYSEAFSKMNRKPTVKLAITIGLIEKDFTGNWFRRINKLIAWAEAEKDYKYILILEREKALMPKRLIATGRVAGESEDDGKSEPELPKDMLPDLERWGQL